MLGVVDVGRYPSSLHRTLKYVPEQEAYSARDEVEQSYRLGHDNSSFRREDRPETVVLPLSAQVSFTVP